MATNFVPVRLFTFLSKFLPFSPSFNLQNLFLIFLTFTIYPTEDILRKCFSKKKKILKKNKSKHFFEFFFSRFFFEFCFPFEFLIFQNIVIAFTFSPIYKYFKNNFNNFVFSLQYNYFYINLFMTCKFLKNFKLLILSYMSISILLVFVFFQQNKQKTL